MAYQIPTYDEYCAASKYARLRYRLGTYIQILATILLILLFVYTTKNIEEMKTNPIDYAEEKMGVICFYPSSPGIGFAIEVENGSGRNYKNTREKD